MELHDTINLMLSADYIDRFKAEYCQLVIRRSKLKNTIEKLERKTANFDPLTPIDLFKQQLLNMNEYCYTLEVRARYEGILLPKEDEILCQ